MPCAFEVIPIPPKDDSAPAISQYKLPHLALWNKARYMLAIGRIDLNNAVCRGISKRKFEQIRDHFLRL
jgi:hypothetical protein